MRTGPALHRPHRRSLRAKVRVWVAGCSLVVPIDVRNPAPVSKHRLAHARDNGTMTPQPGVAPLVGVPREVFGQRHGAMLSAGVSPEETPPESFGCRIGAARAPLGSSGQWPRVGSAILAHRPGRAPSGTCPAQGRAFLTMRQGAPDSARCSRAPIHATHGTAIELPMAL